MLFHKIRPPRAEVQEFLRELVAENERQAERYELERRGEPRTPLCRGTRVIPLSDAGPDLSRSFSAVTKDFTSTGIGVITDQVITAREVLLLLSTKTQSRLLRGRVSHCTPIGGGWLVFGLDVLELVEDHKYAGLSAATLG